MLVNMNTVLRHAEEKQCCVGALSLIHILGGDCLFNACHAFHIGEKRAVFL